MTSEASCETHVIVNVLKYVSTYTRIYIRFI